MNAWQWWWFLLILPLAQANENPVNDEELTKDDNVINHQDEKKQIRERRNIEFIDEIPSHNEDENYEISDSLSAIKRNPILSRWGGQRLSDLLYFKRRPAFSSWGGKRGPAFSSWGGKRSVISEDIKSQHQFTNNTVNSNPLTNEDDLNLQNNENNNPRFLTENEIYRFLKNKYLDQLLRQDRENSLNREEKRFHDLSDFINPDAEINQSPLNNGINKSYQNYNFFGSHPIEWQEMNEDNEEDFDDQADEDDTEDDSDDLSLDFNVENERAILSDMNNKRAAPSFNSWGGKRVPAFNSWGGKRAPAFNSWGGKRAPAFNSWGGKRAPAFNSWGGKRAPAFNSWGGKRAPAFNSWGGKRAPAFNSWGGKRSPAFNSWGGKRAPAFNSWGGKRAAAFSSWGGKRNEEPIDWDDDHEEVNHREKRSPAFNSWGGKRSDEFYNPVEKISTEFNNWEDKRAPAFNSWGGKRAPAFNSWGGKRAPAFNSWGGKRAPAFNSWGGKRAPAFNSWGGKRAPAFNSWGGKRAPAFNSWGGKRAPAFNSWGGKRAPAFNSWGGKRATAFNSWGGKRSDDNNWETKRAPAFNSWGGKRSSEFDIEEKRAPAFNSWGGKRYLNYNGLDDKRTTGGSRWSNKRLPAFHSWGGKRSQVLNYDKSNDNKIHFLGLGNDQTPVHLKTFIKNYKDYTGTPFPPTANIPESTESFPHNSNNYLLKPDDENNNENEQGISEDKSNNAEMSTESDNVHITKRSDGKRDPAFFSWGGKRSEAPDETTIYLKDNINKRALKITTTDVNNIPDVNNNENMNFNNKRSTELRYHPQYTNRFIKSSYETKRRPVFSSWGGKRSENPIEILETNEEPSNFRSRTKRSIENDSEKSVSIITADNNSLGNNIDSFSTEQIYPGIISDGAMICCIKRAQYGDRNLFMQMLLRTKSFRDLSWPTIRPIRRGADFYPWGGKRSLL